MMWIELDNKYYSTYPIKLPKGKKWTKNAIKFSHSNYFYTNIYFFDAGCDLYILFSGSKVQRQYLTIKNYRERKAKEILLDIFYYLSDHCYDYPLGSHFEEGILRFWKMKGLHF